jgi:hypothetical protein
VEEAWSLDLHGGVVYNVIGNLTATDARIGFTGIGIDVLTQCYRQSALIITRLFNCANKFVSMHQRNVARAIAQVMNCKNFNVIFYKEDSFSTTIRRSSSWFMASDCN